MCGFFGEVRLDGAEPDRHAALRAQTALAPRGPDSQGLYSHGRAVLAHRRLEIFDPSIRGSQPMVDPEAGLSLVYNGALYNYRELRQELEDAGHRFFSTSDTEVLLQGFKAWGWRVVERLQGMFAFAIYDEVSGRLTLGRDRLGIKPLYLHCTPQAHRFASSLPGLLAAGGVSSALDPVALHHYFSFHSVVPPELTILKDVKKVPPGTVIELEPGREPRHHRYWSLEYPEQPVELTEEAWVERLLDQLQLAVDRRMVADVPVGVLLSGGLDSSLIVGLLARSGQQGLSTFSVGFEAAGGEKGDEFEYSDVIAKHFSTDHHQIFVDSNRVIQELPACVHAMSEPMVSHDCIGFFLLSAEVARHVKVVQSGQGADEVFAGYHWYPPMLKARDAVAEYQKVFFDRSHEEIRELLGTTVDPDPSLAFVREHFGSAGAWRAIDQTLRMDTTVMLVDDPVKRVDNMTMAWGLEGRVPFLDHELVELAAQIPSELKVREGGKYILKEAARRVIPPQVIDRPKGYFPVPALKYISGPYLEMVKDVLTSPKAVERRLYAPGQVERFLAEPEEHLTPLRGSKLWQMALLEMWLQSHEL